MEYMKNELLSLSIPSHFPSRRTGTCRWCSRSAWLHWYREPWFLRILSVSRKKRIPVSRMPTVVPKSLISEESNWFCLLVEAEEVIEGLVE